MKRLIVITLLFLVAALGGGLIWLANARLMPPPHTVEQSIPHD